MSIGSIKSVTGSAAATTVSPTKRADDPDDVQDASNVSVQMSQMGQLMNQLSTLAQSDPEKFKQVTAQIADKLSDAASQQSGQASDFLNKVADRFKQASQSGKASDLAPQGHPGAHHAGGHHGHRQYVQAADSATNAQTDNKATTLQSVENVISSALETAT